MSRLRTAAAAAVLAVLAYGAISAQEAAVRVSELIVRLGDSAAWDVGEGALVASGTATSPEPDPALRSSAEARRRALARLRQAALTLPFDGQRRVSDLPDEWQSRLLEGLTRAPIAGEWRDGDDRLVAAASVATALGPGCLLSFLLGVEAAPPPGEAGTRPVMLLVLPQATPIRPSLLPRLALPDGSPCFADPEEALRRGGAPVRWFASRESAVRQLPDAQRALEVSGALGDRGEVRLAESACRELARCRLASDYASVAEVWLVAPGLDLSAAGD